MDRVAQNVPCSSASSRIRAQRSRICASNRSISPFENARATLMRVFMWSGGSVSWKVRRAMTSSGVWSSIRMPWAEGQKVRLSVQRKNVGMAGDRPEFRPVGVGCPCHRVFAPEALERVVWRTIDKRVMAREVGISVVVWRPDGQEGPSLVLKALARVSALDRGKGNAHCNSDDQYRRKRLCGTAPEGRCQMDRSSGPRPTGLDDRGSLP